MTSCRRPLFPILEKPTGWVVFFFLRAPQHPTLLLLPLHAEFSEEEIHNLKSLPIAKKPRVKADTYCFHLREKRIEDDPVYRAEEFRVDLAAPALEHKPIDGDDGSARRHAEDRVRRRREQGGVRAEEATARRAALLVLPSQPASGHLSLPGVLLVLCFLLFRFVSLLLRFVNSP
uniref:Uncharacterized protein n=1 Tax=Hordeum vulgare subsp. vulgare TaxID=112509 RepID=A0A8I6WZU0_HORVV